MGACGELWSRLRCVMDPWYTTSDPGDAPGVNALVIGVSSYDYLPEEGDPTSDDTFGLGQLKTPASSAFRFASWLRRDDAGYAYPGARVASIRLLLSPSNEELAADPDLEALMPAMPPPTRANVMEALRDWESECLGHPDSVGVLYAAGHGLQFGDKGGGFVMLQDFAARNAGKLENMLDVGTTRLAMSRDDAPQTQLYFVDACRIEPAEFKPYMANPKAAALDGEGSGSAHTSVVYFAATPGTAAYGDRKKGTLFCEALMQSMEGLAGIMTPSGWAVTVSSLIDALADRLPLLADQLGATLPQNPTVGGEYRTSRTVLHLLAGPPDVEAVITIADPDAARHCRGALWDGLRQVHVARAARLPISWKGPAGSYAIDIEADGPFAHLALEKYPIELYPPPRVEVVVPR